MTPLAPIAQQIWDMKYRFRNADGTAVDTDVAASWRRVADALAEAEPEALRKACWRGLERRAV